MKKVLLVIFHVIIQLLAFSSWIWLSWKYIALFSLVHIVLIELGDGCFLSHAQFKDQKGKNTAFYEWELAKFGVENYNREKLKIFMRYCLPLIIVLLGLIFQSLLKITWIIF